MLLVSGEGLLHACISSNDLIFYGKTILLTGSVTGHNSEARWHILETADINYLV